MKSNRITLIISSAILMAALWARQSMHAGLSTYTRYYVTAILMISFIICVITLSRFFRLRRQQSMSADNPDRNVSERPRQHFRINFEQPPHPLFVERTDERHSVTAFSCPVHDVSETGISLACKGVYDHGQTVQGEIIFDSGRTAPINGIVIRKAPNLACLRLHCTIDPSLLMAEQRDQIALEKGNRPRPMVSKTVLDNTAGSLPSHAPKGICRIKRP